MPWGLPNVLDYFWEPPGVPSDPEDTNVVPDANGGATIYPPGEPAPASMNTFSYPGTSRGMGAGLVIDERRPALAPGETATERQERLLNEWADRIAGENKAYRDYLAGESSRRFGITEQRLSAADRAAADRARAQTAATEAGTSAQRQSAAERLAFERQQAGQTTADRERSQRVALATALLGMSTGPNGPANRRMALDLLSGLGVNTAGGQGGGPVQPPNLIPPALWDTLPPGAKTLLLNAWEAQGGNPGDFQFAINSQRPQGEPSAPARVRYAAPAGA